MSPAWARRSSRSWRPARSRPSKKRRTRCVPGYRDHRAGAAQAAVYAELYALYRKLYFAFGQRNSTASELGDVLPELRRIAARARGGTRVLEALRTEVLEANLELVRRGLVLYTFGNASGVSREHGLVVIKPSGVPYEKMTPADMVITDLEGNIVEGSLRPSSDLATHVGALPRVPRDRRRRAHALAPRHRMGAGAAARFPASAPPTPITSTARSR